MSIKDLSTAWDEAAQRVSETALAGEITPEQISSAAGLHVRTGLAAGMWGISEFQGCTDDCTAER